MISSMWARGSLFVAALLAVSACSDDPIPPQFFSFSRPDQLAMACFDPADSSGAPLRAECCSTRFGVSRDHEMLGESDSDLPLDCCSNWDFTTNAYSLCRTPPALHALVGQTRRGEIAAVDLAAGLVIDGDQLIPGFTFIDVGELPTAVVVPEVDPARAIDGPRWTYVASAGEREIRAVATCRFRVGNSCGPESEIVNCDGIKDPDELSECVAEGSLLLAAVTRVKLPSTPVDMITDGVGYLWISLPKQQMLGRLKLNIDDPNDPSPFAPGPDGGPPVLEEFLIDGTFPLVALRAGEDSAYTAQCGKPFSEDVLVGPPISETELESLPDAGMDAGASDAGPEPGDAGDAGDVADAGDAGAGAAQDGSAADGGMSVADAGGAPEAGAPARAVQPARLRFDPESRLLLASDLETSALHAWRLEGVGPVPLISIATGAPIRDFAMTPRVPEAVELYSKSGGEYTPNEPGFPGPKVRYIYAIDDRNGTLMAMRFLDEEGASPSIELVLSNGPVPHKDRLAVPGNLQALDIIDTREIIGGGVCENTARLPLGDSPARTQAPGYFLNGVFVATVAADGRMSILDVHDREVFCRRDDNCDVEGGDGEDSKVRPDKLQEGDGKSALAVRRHSVRTTFVPELIAAGDANEMAAFVCPEGYFPADPEGDRKASEPAFVCVNGDPWMQQSSDWNVVYEDFLSGGGRAQGRMRKVGGEYEFQSAGGFDFCTRGVVDKGGDYKGDYLYLSGLPPGAPKDCSEPSSESPHRFAIREAYDNRLVLNGSESKLAAVARCYGDFVPFWFGVNDRHLVRRSSADRHNVMTAEDGRCVQDPEIDDRTRSRLYVPQLGEDDECLDGAEEVFEDVMDEDGNVTSTQLVACVFKNPFVTFAPRVVEGGSRESLRVAVRVQGTPTLLFDTVSTSSVTATLPVTLRFYPGSGQVFVVDSAQEGLRSWGAYPFTPDPRTYR